MTERDSGIDCDARNRPHRSIVGCISGHTMLDSHQCQNQFWRPLRLFSDAAHDNLMQSQKVPAQSDIVCDGYIDPEHRVGVRAQAMSSVPELKQLTWFFPGQQ